jgi:hypothetical protein
MHAIWGSGRVVSAFIEDLTVDLGLQLGYLAIVRLMSLPTIDQFSV